MKIPYSMIKAQLGKTVPFAKHAGVEIVSLGDGVSEAKLAQTPTSINHLGTQHAGALYTLGETASGAAMAGALARKILKVKPVAASATIQYMKVAKGEIRAQAKTLKPSKSLLTELDTNGRTSFDISVSLRDEQDVEVALMTVNWHVKMRKS